MATVRAFEAIRPAKEYAEKVLSLPYDVMNRKEAAEMAAGNPYSFLHICRSEIDLPDQEDPYDRSVYEKARDNIAKYLDTGVFIREERPAIYIYREIMDGRVQTGIVGCVAVDEFHYYGEPDRGWAWQACCLRRARNAACGSGRVRPAAPVPCRAG